MYRCRLCFKSSSANNMSHLSNALFHLTHPELCQPPPTSNGSTPRGAWIDRLRGGNLKDVQHIEVVEQRCGCKCTLPAIRLQHGITHTRTQMLTVNPGSAPSSTSIITPSNCAHTHTHTPDTHLGSGTTLRECRAAICEWRVHVGTEPHEFNNCLQLAHIHTHTQRAAHLPPECSGRKCCQRACSLQLRIGFQLDQAVDRV